MRRSKTLRLGPLVDLGHGESSMTLGGSTYVLDTADARAIRGSIMDQRRLYEATHPDDAFGLATAMFTLLAGRLPEPHERLGHLDHDPRNLRRANIFLSTQHERCTVNLRRVPLGTTADTAGIDRLGPGRYRARLQVPGKNAQIHCGIHPTRAKAHAARNKMRARLRAEAALSRPGTAPDGTPLDTTQGDTP